MTVGILIFSRVFRLGAFFAEFTALRETVASCKVDLEEAIADNKTELQQAIADNKAEIVELRQEMRDDFNRIDAGFPALRGYFVSRLENHADFRADDD